MLLRKVHYVAPHQEIQSISTMSRMSLRKKYFWFVFSRFRTEYREIQRICLYSLQIRKYTDQKNSKYKHLSRSVYLSECINLFPILKIEFVACLKSVNLGISLLHSFNSNCISLTFSNVSLTNLLFKSLLKSFLHSKHLKVHDHLWLSYCQDKTYSPCIYHNKVFQTNPQQDLIMSLT